MWSLTVHIKARKSALFLLLENRSNQYLWFYSIGASWNRAWHIALDWEGMGQGL
jgi:hypothetical protein